MNLGDAHLIRPEDVQRNPAEHGALDAEGNLQVLPAAFWQGFSQAEIAYFCNRHAFYCVPTTELVAWVKEKIGERKAIEIGAGHGALGRALGIPMTDNHMQTWPHIAAYYAAGGQPTISYGADVVQCDAQVAWARYKPKVTVAAWVTHRWNAKAPERSGNMHGVEEGWFVDRSDYLFIGNEHVHRGKPLWDRPHEILYPDWLVSRALNGSRDFIAYWKKGAK